MTDSAFPNTRLTAASAVLPRDVQLAHAERLLRAGALILMGLAGLLVLAALLTAGNGSAWIGAVQTALLFRFTGPADAGLVVTIALLVGGAVLLLIGAVGVIAREVWTLPYLVLVVLLALASIIGIGFTPAVIVMAIISLTLTRLRGVMRAFRLNPVLMKEMRGRMRGMRAFAVLTIYLIIMSAITLLLYALYGSVARSTGSAAVGDVGRGLFYGVAGVELLLILFVAPSFTAGAITGERERQTYDLLQTTLLTHPTLILGKLTSALSFVVLLLLAGIPLQSLAFLFGGVTEVEIVVALLLLLATAVLVCAIGMYFSSALPRTLLANSRAYGATILGLFLVPFVVLLLMNLALNALFPARQMAIPAAVEGMQQYAQSLLAAVNPISAGISAQTILVNEGSLLLYTSTLRADGSSIPMLSPWIIYIVLALGAAALLIIVTIATSVRRAQDDNAALVPEMKQRRQLFGRSRS